jgi:hypothetical protein
MLSRSQVRDGTWYLNSSGMPIYVQSVNKETDTVVVPFTEASGDRSYYLKYKIDEFIETHSPYKEN